MAGRGGGAKKTDSPGRKLRTVDTPAQCCSPILILCFKDAKFWPRPSCYDPRTSMATITCAEKDTYLSPSLSAYLLCKLAIYFMPNIAINQCNLG